MNEKGEVRVTNDIEGKAVHKDGSYFLESARTKKEPFHLIPGGYEQLRTILNLRAENGPTRTRTKSPYFGSTPVMSTITPTN